LSDGPFSISFGLNALEACCACGGGDPTCSARYTNDFPPEGTEFEQTTLFRFGFDDISLDTNCCNLCKINDQCEYWFRDIGSGEGKVCYLGRSAGIRKRRFGARYRGGYKACSVTDGSGASSAYPCSCGATTCTRGQRCFADTNVCTGAFVTPLPYVYPVADACESPTRSLTLAECEAAASTLGVGFSGFSTVAGPRGCIQDLSSTGSPPRPLRWRDSASGYWLYNHYFVCTTLDVVPGFPNVIPTASSNALAVPGVFSLAGIAWLPTLFPQDNVFPGTCIQTNVEEGAFWRVDFPAQWQLQSVTLLSRADCCEDELRNVDIFIGTSGSNSFSKCASDVSVRQGAAQNIPCVGTGSAVKIQHINRRALTLCGFRAFGTQLSLLPQTMSSESATLNVNVSEATPSSNPTALIQVVAAAPDTVVISGSCVDGINAVFTTSGTTSSGAPFFNSNTGYVLYFDPDCDGRGKPSRWIIGTNVINSTRSSDLDDDGACSFEAAMTSPTAEPPLGSMSWRMLCDGNFEDRNMTLQIGDTVDWRNNFGLSCTNYITQGWCSSGSFRDGFEWTGQERYLDVTTVPQDCQASDSFQRDGNCAEFFNYPGRNCVACGKGTVAACSVLDGSALSSSYPCLCGTATCTSGQTCVSDSNTCQGGQMPTETNGIVVMVLSNCTTFIAEENASSAVAEGLARTLRLPASFVSVQLSCDQDSLQVSISISVPQARLSEYDPATIARNIGNVDKSALEFDIADAVAGRRIMTSNFAVTSSSAEDTTPTTPTNGRKRFRPPCRTVCWR